MGAGASASSCTIRLWQNNSPRTTAIAQVKSTYFLILKANFPVRCYFAGKDSKKNANSLNVRLFFSCLLKFSCIFAENSCQDESNPTDGRLADGISCGQLWSKEEIQ